MKSGRESLGRHGDTSFHPPGPTPPSRPTLATSVLFSFFLSFFLPLLSIESFNAVSLCAKRGDREGRGEARAEQREERGATDPANVAISSFLFSFLPPCHFFPSLPVRRALMITAAPLLSSPRREAPRASERASGWVVCTRKNFWSSSNKSFRPLLTPPFVFSATTVNKRSARLWRFRADYRKLAELC